MNSCRWCKCANPKMSGEVKVMYDGEAFTRISGSSNYSDSKASTLAKRNKAMERLLKTSSSLAGPTTRLRQPSQSSYTISFIELHLSQCLHCPSTMPASNKGPTNKIETSSMDLAISATCTGNRPNSRNESCGVAWPWTASTHTVMTVLAKHVKTTARHRALMTEGVLRFASVVLRSVEDR